MKTRNRAGWLSFVAVALLACGVTAPGRLQAGVTLALTQTPSPATVTNGLTVQVDATVTATAGESVDSCSLVFRTLAAGTTNWWNANAMSNVVGSVWRGSVPRLPQGGVDYFAIASYTGGSGSPAPSATNSYTISGTNDFRRYTDFSGWTQDGGSSATNFYRTIPGTDGSTSNRWYASGAAITTLSGSKPQYDGADSPSPRFYLRTIQGAYMRSPLLSEGAGTLYFVSCLRNSWTNTVSVEVQITTNTTPSGWQTVQTLSYSNTTTQSTPVSINRRDVRYVQLLQPNPTFLDVGTTAADRAVCFDNLVLSLCPSAVELAPIDPVDPAAPVSMQPVTVRCALSDVDANVPSINRRLLVSYQWNTNQWASIAMTNASGTTFAAVIPGMETGTNFYYFSCDFDGYYFTRDPDGTGPAGVYPGTPTNSRVTVTNSYPILYEALKVQALSTNLLAFGDVATNAPTVRMLTLSNSGNALLTVTNILSSDPAFTVAPTDFTLAADGGSTNVLVTFHPSAYTGYAATLTVLSDKTDGPDSVTLTGTGVPAELVSVPTAVTGPSAGTRLQTLSFTASGAANTYPSHPLQYRFNWGDGQIDDFGSNTQTHAWTTTNTFGIVVQARCADHTNIVSSWSSELASVLVTNTRIIQVTGTLAFGDVVTNTTSTLSIAVTNSGTGPLTVSSITGPAFVTITPTNFVVAAGGSSNVDVTFKPTALADYSGLLTVNADRTSGSNTLAITGRGVPVEVVSAPTAITGPSTGTRLQPLVFTASGATNNYPARLLDYRFSWGDNTTSFWGSATQTNFWSSTNLFGICAQARSQYATNTLSPWSSVLASVLITNTRIIQVIGDLNFGTNVIHTTATRNVTVTNSGTGPFTVSAIACPMSVTPVSTNYLSLAPTNFIVAEGGSSNVTVSFTPHALGAYAGTLTVYANQTSGSNSLLMSATVVDTETVTLLSFTNNPSNPRNGAIGETLTYTALATNNYGHQVEYRFAWDSTRTSAWATVSSAATNWATAGTYAVSVQARCASNTTVVTVPAWSAPIMLTIREAPVVSVSTNADNGQWIPVSVTNIPGATSCTFFYSPEGATLFQSLPLTQVGALWEGLIPPLNAGAMRYYVQYTLAGPDTIIWPSGAPYPVSTVSASLGDRRFTDFTGWVRDTNAPGGASSTNFYLNVTGGDQWLASGALAGATSGTKPDGGSNPWLYLRSIQGSYLRSPPMSGGVGTIYFTSCMINSRQAAQVAVQVCTEALPTNWQTVATLDYPARLVSPTFQLAAPIKLDRQLGENVRYVRFVRMDISDNDFSQTHIDGAVAFDNVGFSYPPTDVTISERLRNPGYPARDQDVKVRCQVTDLYTNYPSANRQVRCYYSWQSATPPFTSNVTMAVTNNLYYEGTIPRQAAGTVYYYFQCDFDGYYYSRDPDGPTSLPSIPAIQGTNNENRVRAYYPTNAVAASPSVLSYEVRRYRSMFDRVMIESDPPSVSAQTELINSNTWQGISLVKGITNLTWRFVGYDAYTNDAVAFDTNVYSWGDNDQDFPFPPIAGYCERPATNDMRAELDYEGFLLFRINTDPAKRDYIVKRAVYQNFDVWQASAVYFEESLGLYAVKSFTNDFNGWTDEHYVAGDTIGDTLELLAPVAGQPYVTVPTVTSAGTTGIFAYVQGKAVSERGYVMPPLVPNTALTLSADNMGRVWGTSRSFTPGIENFSFTGRASVDDMYFALYKGTTLDSPFTGANWLGDYVVTTTLRARQISPAAAYVSTMVDYQPTYFGGGVGSFYEVRLVQITDVDTARSDNNLQIQVWRWNDGSSVPTWITNSATASTTINDQRLDSLGSKSLEITVSNTVAGATSLRVRYDMAGGAAWSPNVLVFKDTSAGRLTGGGSVGFTTFDAIPEINKLDVKTAASGTPMLSITDWSTATMGNWFLGGKRRDGSADRWQVDVAAKSLFRPLLAINIGVYTAPAVANLDQPNFSALVPRYALSITELKTNVFTVPLKEWNKMFVELRNGMTNAAQTLNDFPVVVDNLQLTPWRAKTRSAPITAGVDDPEWGGLFYRDWTSWNSYQYPWLNTARAWAVLEGWVGPSFGSSGNEVTFERSRANPSLVQGLISPVLSNGIGSIAFDYRVSDGLVAFAIERSAQDDQRTYETLLVVSNSSGLSTPLFLPVRELFSGRIRVRLLPESDPYAVLKIDNLWVRDYPPRDETTWQAYNGLITSLQTTRSWEPTKTTAQTAFLNNSVSSNTAGAEVLSEYQPFIQSPKVGTGIGEIGFWYRVWDTNGSGHIALQVAPELDSPEPWTTITNLYITNTEYQYFTMEPYDLQNKVLRIACFTNNSNRVCLDNVLMTEPVRAGYEIRSVTITPAQPLASQLVNLEVEVGRFIMNPTGIRIFISYRADTNAWGYTNWWTETDTAGSSKIELQQDPLSPRKFRSVSGSRIPAMAVDTPVQYIAWGRHDTLTPDKGAPIFQGTNTFANPSWYYPRDLNAEYSAQGWSPYYFVYSCLPGAVWVNEVNYRRIFPQETNNEYVEVIGPANVQIGGWRVEQIRYTDYAILDTCTVPPGFTLEDSTNGWGFFVWGDPGVPNVNVAFGVPTSQNLQQNGGVRLIRSMGAWEQRLCWGSLSSVAGMINNGYIYIGTKSSSASRLAPLHLVGDGNAYSNFVWEQASSGNYTPGGSNKDQVLAPPDVAPPTFFMIYSVIGPNGSQSAEGSPVANIQVEIGGATSIVYSAASWFRIASCLTNGAPVSAAVGQTNYLWSVTNVQSDCSNSVTFVAATQEQTGLEVPPAWASGYYVTEAAALADANIATDYLLNLNPTGTYAIELMFSSITVSGSSISNVVQLTDGALPLDTTINGRLVLQGKMSLLDATWEDIGSATISNANFGADGTYGVLFTDLTNSFFQAVIKP